MMPWASDAIAPRARRGTLSGGGKVKVPSPLLGKRSGRMNKGKLLRVGEPKLHL